MTLEDKHNKKLNFSFFLGKRKAPAKRSGLFRDLRSLFNFFWAVVSFDVGGFNLLHVLSDGPVVEVGLDNFFWE